MNYLPLKQRLLYYNALIRPVINYASVLWTNCDKEYLGKVLKLQKRAARVILNAPPPPLAPSVPLFNRLKCWISLVILATEFYTSLSSSICQPASINKSSSGNRARYGFIEVDISTGLDELIDLGKPSSICRYRARNVEDGEARTLTFPGGQVECYRAR